MSAILQDHATVTLPEGFTARGASLPDVEPAIVLYNRWSQSAIGEDEITDADAIRNEWKSPRFDPARDIRVVFAMDGDEVAGICLCRPHSYDDPEMGYVSTLGVRRAWRKRGVGLALLRHSFGSSIAAASPAPPCTWTPAT
jgi:ribosomal protein S18 acetylase RimI-like enzyme